METINKIAINCTVVELEINGTETHYDYKIWIEDENEDDGGSFQVVLKKYDKPKIVLHFIGEVNAELQIGATYFDGLNMFRAISNNKIQNQDNRVNTFLLPKELVCVSDFQSMQNQ